MSGFDVFDARPDILDIPGCAITAIPEGGCAEPVGEIRLTEADSPCRTVVDPIKLGPGIHAAGAAVDGGKADFFLSRMARRHQ